MTDELDLFQGTLDVLVLRALSHGLMHGYAVARWIQDGSDGTFRILDGALYPSLHRMEEKGWVGANWGTSEVSSSWPSRRQRLAQKWGSMAATESQPPSDAS